MREEITEINRYLRALKTKGLLPTGLEICGYAIGHEVVQLMNVAPDPTKNYNIPGQDIPYILNNDVVVWHTHTADGYDSLSVEDVSKARGLEKPHYMFNVHTGASDYYDPLELRPYEGRPWSFAHANCWTLATDFLSREFGCEFSDRFYLEYPKQWKDPSWDPWRQSVRTEGFEPVPMEQAQRGDLAVLPYGCKVPSHCAIVWNVEKNEVLHQLAGGVSKIVNFDQKWRVKLWPENHLWRHKNAPS